MSELFSRVSKGASMSLSTTSLPDMLGVEHQTFLIQFDMSGDPDSLTMQLETIGARTVSTVTPADPDREQGPLLLVEMLVDQTPEQAIETLSGLPGVAFAELNATVSILDMGTGSSDITRVGDVVEHSNPLTFTADLAPAPFAIVDQAQAAPEAIVSTNLITPATWNHQSAPQPNPFDSAPTSDIGLIPYAPVDDMSPSTEGLWTLSGGQWMDAAGEMAWSVSAADAQMTVTIDAVSNDPGYVNGSLWGMYGDKTVITNQFGSQAGEAWTASFTGTTKTVVGVVDTGIDYTHPDLYLNVWLNQGEIPSSIRSHLTDSDHDGLITFRDLNDGSNKSYVTDINKNGYIDAGDLLKDSRWVDGIDQDGNGYKDDLVGWDFVNNDNNPFDDNGHGTHVSGTIGAMGGNGAGVAGVDWTVQIVAMKFLNASGSGSIDGAIQAINYFTHEAQATPTENFVATNNSWGGAGASQALTDAVTLAAKNDILFVAAAGNSATNTDIVANYPSDLSTATGASYDAVISVASLTSAGVLSSFSNYGATTVDLAAPGSSIYSTLPGGVYGTMSGTSMATPFVTGAVALYAAAHPDATAADIKTALLASTDATASLSGLTLTGGRLDIGNLLNPAAQPLDIASGVNTLASLVAGQPQISTIDTAGDQDWFRITLVAGNQYDFTMNPGAGSGLDSYLRLLDANGLQLAFNDDLGTPSCHISYIATTGGTYYVSAQGHDTSVGAYNLSVTTSPAPTVINGGSGNDLLIGGALNETLNGDAGNDTLNGGIGADTMVGGIGDDVYYVDYVGDVVVEGIGQGSDDVYASVTYTLSANVEHLTLTGSAGINGTGNAINNIITGNSGANALDGGAGADTMIGGAGDDIYRVDNVGDIVIENGLGGNDGVVSSINYTLTANVEGLALSGSASINGTGNSMNNTIYGNSGNNVIDGAGGADLMIGGAGNDTYVVDNPGDYVVEDVAGGTDNVLTSISYMLTANVENLTLTGSTGINGFGNSLNNMIVGNAGNNYIDGGAGQDSLVGGAGNDTLNGGLGNDTLDGGSGADAFVFNTPLIAGNIDTIVSFNAVEDKILIDHSIFTAFGKLGPIDYGALASGPIATEFDDHIVFNKTSGDLFYDADGNGRLAAVQFATIANLNGLLSSQNFIVI